MSILGANTKHRCNCKWQFIDVCHSVGALGFLCHVATVSDTSSFVRVVVDNELKTGKTSKRKGRQKPTNLFMFHENAPSIFDDPLNECTWTIVVL